MKPAAIRAGRRRTCGSRPPIGSTRISPTTCCGRAAGRAIAGYFRTLAENATATIGWLHGHGVDFVTPLYYLSAGPARIQPVGGGGAIVAKLLEAAKRAGVNFVYQFSGQPPGDGGGEQVSGVEARSRDGVAMLDADAVILACGGFQGNPAMMRAHFGPGAEIIKLISPGTRFDTGDGIRVATEQGAGISGDWNGMHIEPVDPRAANSAAVVLVYPYGIVVDADGRRFFDEGGGLMHETWEALAREIHFARPRSIAYAILNSRLFDIDGFERAIRSEVPPYRAQSIEALAAQIRIPAGQSARRQSMPSMRRRPVTPRASMRRAATGWGRRAN